MTATHDYAGISAWNFKLKAKVKSYEDAEQFARCHPTEVVGGLLWQEWDISPQMILRWDGEHDYWAIVLYDTEIIRYYPDGTFSVDNGGFATPTTTERLQAVLPDGFHCYHFSTREIKGKLGLRYTKGEESTPYAKRRKVQSPDTLWPLDHSKRVTLDGRTA